MKKSEEIQLPVGTQALVLSKIYYGALTKSLENVEVERYFSVLYFLYNHRNCCQQIVCDNLKIDKTAMVKVLDYLGKSGLIERKVNPEDRREHFISLSKKGEKQAKEIAKNFKRLEEKAFANINDSERRTFIKVLQKMSANLKELPSDNLSFNYKKTKSNI